MRERRLVWLLSIISICWLFSFQAHAAEQLYGAEISDAASINIAELTRNPDLYVDKLIKIEGLIADVCPMKGCWVDVLEEQSSATIRVKVKDDVIVFPASAKGNQITAQGYLRRHELTRKQAVKWLRHIAQEKGESFDQDTVKGAMTFYQIEGLGALVSESAV